MNQDEEGFGNVICTHLMRCKMWPLIRFDIGDIGKLMKIEHQG